MARAPRNHHFIPQFYLKGFTGGKSKKSKLFGLNLKERRIFETSPRNVGSSRDFNRILLDGVPSDTLEEGLAQFDGIAAKALKAVLEGSPFEGKKRTILLNLITLLAIRSPGRREHWRLFEERVIKRVLGVLLESEERWEIKKKALDDKDQDMASEVSYEEIKKFHEDDAFSITLPRESHVQLEFELFDESLPLFLKRKWRLIRAIATSESFITTDNPVVLMWNNPPEFPTPFNQSPGFGLKDTKILFPLGSHAILVGEFDGDEGTIGASDNFVAGANSMMLAYADKQAYACKSSFPYIGPDGEIYNDQLLFERFPSQ